MKKIMFLMLVMFTTSALAIGTYLRKNGDEWTYTTGDGVSNIEVGDGAIAIIYSDPGYQSLGMSHSENDVMKNAKIYLTTFSMPGWGKIVFNGGKVSPSDVPNGAEIAIGKYAVTAPAPEPSKPEPEKKKRDPSDRY